MTEIIPIFPSLIVKHDTKPEFDGIKEYLIEEIYYEMEKNEGVKKSNVGGWQSNVDIFTRSRFSRAGRFVMQHSKKALSHLFNPGYKLLLKGAWINVNTKDSFNECHIHPDCDIAGVFWIDVPPESGDLVVINSAAYSNFKWLSKVTDSVREQYRYTVGWDLNAVSGEMVFFPSDMLHKVNINNNSENRISIAFNLSLQ
nr:conserved hypothetical protein (TIGR02466) [uncultured Mediterranean phage uvMED]|tara:strand:+ start:441 stop:1037 length:597 start_codon:yes stop_codon:yes gene_type:complete